MYKNSRFRTYMSAFACWSKGFKKRKAAFWIRFEQRNHNSNNEGGKWGVKRHYYVISCNVVCRIRVCSTACLWGGVDALTTMRPLSAFRSRGNRIAMAHRALSPRGRRKRKKAYSALPMFRVVCGIKTRKTNTKKAHSA